MKIAKKILAAAIAAACTMAFSSFGASAALAATPFKASVGTASMNLVTAKSNGYAHINYGSTTPDPVTLYTVAIPVTASTVSLDFGTNDVLTYNYCSADDNDETAWICPWYEDATKGFTSTDVKVDYNEDFTMDFIRVQNPYNADYSGGELLYAITFKTYDAVTSTAAYFIGELGAEVAQVSATAKNITVPKAVKKTSVNSIAPKVFSGAKATKVIVKSTTLTKGSVKNCFKDSKVKTVKVPAKKLKAYKKIFAKAVCGKAVKVVK